MVATEQKNICSDFVKNLLLLFLDQPTDDGKKVKP